MDEDDVTFWPAPMVPMTWMVQCVGCGAAVEIPEVTDDDAGVFYAANEHCVIQCECGTWMAPTGASVQEVTTPPWSAKYDL